MAVRRKLLVLVAALALALVAAAPAAAAPPPQAKGQVKVATYNLFLGGDIGALLAPGVDTLEEFLAAATVLWTDVQASNIPARAEAVADLLSEDRPDVVGLQEVADWTSTPLAQGVPAPSYDYLDLLLAELRANGTPYRVLVTNTNFDSPTIPLPSAGVAVHYTDRDVVIARSDLPSSQLTDANSAANTFTARIVITLPFSPTPISIIRGWSRVDVTVRGATYRFANTHLEAFNATVRGYQAQELAAGLAGSPYPVVLVGDLNSDPGQEAQLTLTSALGLDDAWALAGHGGPGFTSGNDDLTGPNALDRRIDYVLFGGAASPDLRAVNAHVIGEEYGDRTDTVPPLWPSDHAGVVATLHVGTP